MSKFELDFEDFVSTRIGCSSIRTEYNAEYEAAMEKLAGHADVMNTALNAIDIAERSAYLHGLHDGLSIMAMFEK